MKSQIIATVPCHGDWLAVFVHELKGEKEMPLFDARPVALWAVLEFEAESDEVKADDAISPIVSLEGVMVPATTVENYVGVTPKAELKALTNSPEFVEAARAISRALAAQEVASVAAEMKPSPSPEPTP